jgi:hypothetical protein
MILVGLVLLLVGLAVDATTVWALGAATTAVGAAVVLATARQLRPGPAVDRRCLEVVGSSTCGARSVP